MLLLLIAISAITLRHDAIQHRLARHITNTLQQTVGVPVEIGNVRLNLPNNIIIDSLLIKDQSQETLANLPRIAANFDILPFIRNGKINIHTITLSHPDIRIYREVPEAPLNIQFLLEKFASSDTTSNKSMPEICIKQIHIHDGHLRYDVLSEPEDENFTPSHIDIRNLHTNLALRALREDTLSLYVRRISFDEASGFTLRRLKGNVNASNDKIDITRLRISLPQSNIMSDAVRITFPDEGSHKQPTFNGELRSDKLSAADFTSILPRLAHFGHPLNFNIKFNGTEQEVNIKSLQISSTDKKFDTKISGWLKKLSQKEPEYNINLSSLTATPDFISSLYTTATDGENTPEELLRLGNMALKGSFHGEGRQATGDAEVTSEAGVLSTNFNLDKAGIYSATLLANELNIGKITHDNTWGYCNMNVTVNGNTLDSIGHTGDFSAIISPLQYKQYTYSPIKAHGTYNDKQIDAHMQLNDSNALVYLSLEYDKSKELPKYELSLEVDSLNPFKLRLTDKNESNYLSFRMESELVGNNPDHMRLNTDIYDFTLSTPNEREKIHQFHISANFLEREKSLIVNSDFINGYLTGYYSCKTLENSVKLALRRVLPSLITGEQVYQTDNNFVFHFNIGNTGTLTKIFSLPVTIKEHSMLYGNCNDQHHLFNLAGNLKGVEYGKRDYRYIDFNSSIDNKQNKNRIKLIRKPIPTESESYNPENEITIEVSSNIYNDSLFTNICWNNIYAPVNRGDVGIDITLQRNDENKIDVTALLHEGEIIQSDTLWKLTPSSIRSSGNSININNFSLQGAHRHLRVNGNVGANQEDRLDVDLRNIDLEYVFDILDFHPVNIGGEASGNIQASALMDKLNFNSKLQIKNLTFEHGLIGDLDFNGYWDDEQQAIMLKGDAKERDGSSRTLIDGFVSPARDTLNIGIEAQNTRIDFLNHLLSGFIGDASGRVSGKLHILGAMRDVNMQGALAPLGHLRIKPINAVYNLVGDTIQFTRNKIGFNSFQISDNHGNSGLVTGGVYHNSLKNFTCGFHIKAHNLLAFHYPTFGEESFYGTAFVTGDADFSVNQSGTNLRANVTTGPGSKFIYNASTPEGNINNEFVTFIDRNKRRSLIHNLDKFLTEEQTDNIRSQLNLDFMIDVTPDMQLRVYTNQASNDYIDIYGSGKVNAIYDEKGGFTMQGNLGLTRGTYKFTLQDIFPKEFDIRSGSSVAFNGDPFNAKLDLRTVYTIPSVPLTDLSIDAERRKNVKVNCFMDITGTIFAPNLAFDLELPDGNEEEKELLSSAISTPEQLNMQFIYLLGIGKFYTYDYNNQNNESQSSTAMESLISNTISGQLNNMLSQIIDNGNWNISGNFTTSEKGWNSMEVEGMLSGRLLDNRLLINGNLGYRDNPMANKNFIGDFEVQWLLNKSGNISLKAYNKTTDRYFSKTTLTTQGAGILLKREFDGWKFWQRQY